MVGSYAISIQYKCYDSISAETNGYSVKHKEIYRQNAAHGPDDEAMALLRSGFVHNLSNGMTEVVPSHCIVSIRYKITKEYM